MNDTIVPPTYYVDEAGDSTLFSRKGKILVGSEGCSSFFILGLLEVGNAASLHSELESLREELLADPYFKNVPSIQSHTQKTAVAFHAKDDLPEVRREVFSLLRKRDDLRFFAVVLDKMSTLAYVQNRQSHDPTYHYKPDETYDFLVRRLFKERLHEFDKYRVVFARRGNRKRTAVLKEQLEIAQHRFLSSHRKPETPAVLTVESGTPQNSAGLQTADYFLWALQRLYERHEERYLLAIRNQYKLVIDIHDNRKNAYGEYYNKQNPISWEKVAKRI